LVRELGGFNVFSGTPNLVAAKVTAIWMRERKQAGGPDREDNTIIVMGRGYRADVINTRALPELRKRLKHAL
jgi:hypothetical protein